ncbi:Uncharacterized protein LOK49_LG10G01282 [Camellia lanceoleosa]|uniref:Uncharacterized protein n=1 Tax=Camellia lanceoleosa TaxID=1840588 RepID=A0ACC0GDT2_9ERIC|nr:Uncharacterized protein LOK49_LG10G01282 [Camellia lanceoleosa]
MDERESEKGTTVAQRQEDPSATTGTSIATGSLQAQPNGNPVDPSTEEIDQQERHHHKSIHSPGITSSSLSFKDALTTPLFPNSTPTPSTPDTFSDDEALVEDEDEFVPAITLSSEDKAHIRTPWLKAIIVKLMGRNIGFNYFMTKIKALWKPTGAIVGLDLGNHFYIIKFLNDEDLSKVLNEGPWFIGAHFIAVRKWELEFQATHFCTHSTVVWARLTGLPIEFFDRSILQKIGAKLGTLLKIDVHTENGNKWRFSRLCVQVDLSKPLIAKVKIGTIIQQVSYEGISSICFDCGKLGHKRGNCNTSLPTNSHPPLANPPLNTPTNTTPTISPKTHFRPWMLVDRHRKTTNRPPNHPPFRRKTNTLVHHPTWQKVTKPLTLKPSVVLVQSTSSSDPAAPPVSSGPLPAAPPQAPAILHSNTFSILTTLSEDCHTSSPTPPILVCPPLTSSSETFTIPSSDSPDSVSLTSPNDPICLHPPNPFPLKPYNTLTPLSHPLNNIPPLTHSSAYPTNASSPHPSPAKHYNV